VNTGRTSIIFFLLFFVALFAAMPLIGVSPAAAIAAGAVSALSFIYAMYLWLWGMRKGDPWLVRRGVGGTAEYKLEVTRAGHGPYRTTLYICAHLHKGTTVPVKVSRWDHKRVTVDGPALSDGDEVGRSAWREQKVQEAST
jgi:hypothetical protein